MLRPGITQTAALRRETNRSASSLIIGILVFVGIAVNIYFVSPTLVDVPIRFLYMIALVWLFFTLAGDKFARSLMISRTTILAIIYLAAVGLLLAIRQGNTQDLVQIMVGNYAQPIILLLVSITGTLLIGQRSMTSAFLIAVGISALFSLLQALNLKFATDIREYLGIYYFENIVDQEVLGDRNPGLSYSTIILGNQICLAFALYVAGSFNDFGRGRALADTIKSLQKRYSRIAIASAIMIVICVVGGNRSPLLGLLIFFAFLFSAGNRRLVFISIALLVTAYYFVDPVREALTESGLRVASVGDKSELARYPLAMYGFRLFIENPLGYGATFESKDLFNTVRTGDLVSYAWGLGNVFGERDLHNSWITALNVYGIFVVPAFAYFVINSGKHWAYIIAFIPYMVHISFHNAAPLGKDYIFWIPVGILMAAAATSATTSAATAATMTGMSARKGAEAKSARRVKAAIQRRPQSARRVQPLSSGSDVQGMHAK